ncbi:MAG TPA: hypothetical protein VLF66_19135 [Thermoanaerobaculia bacterium]|nr:hypothetical protein [Thermoanaerobaculia bacterium]
MIRSAALLAALLGACGSPSTAPVAAPAPASGAEPQPAIDGQPYADPHGFAFSYPASLILLAEPDPLPERRPPLVHRVRLLDRELAAGDTADLEPPQFSVEVYAGAEGPLRPWLQAHGRIPAGSAVEALEVPGAREALRVRDPRLLAPNEFYWYVAGRHILLVVALGSEGEAVHETFSLLGGETGGRDP